MDDPYALTEPYGGPYTRLAAPLAYARAFFLTDMRVVHEVEANEVVSANRIASFQSGPGVLLREWEDVDLADY